ncbi:conserved unknown protein [Ectocarpus siliculosus]|uniref:Uncharacterized protein n=1 Tax=Ectocarpus siliculosus TaxID=2880 RepID=D7FM52_ECTSI|nr:conserved unknown protein [Ectocarpus siliculosus]|eukprot:CBJ29877.1 conserved unknown protein [Ectocarpus siliculosus]
MPGRPTCALVVLGLACSTRGGDGFVGPTAGGRPRAALARGRAAITRATTAPSRRSAGLVRMATDQEKEGVATEEPKDELGDDKLIYDARSGRFYEKKLEEVCREEYCAIDETTGKPMLLTTGEKERIFTDAIQSFYYNQRQMLDDDDFDKLKEDLAWEGSPVVLMNRDEQLFMSAMAAYSRGDKIIDDEEFDRLKASLRESGSVVAVSTEPKCYIDTGICTVTFQEDLFRRFATYLPANFIFGLAFLGASWQIIEPIRYLNPLATLLLLTAPTIAASKKFTDLCLYQDNGTVASGPCPSCGAQNRVFFGSMLGVKGNIDDSEFKCDNCGEIIKIRRADLRARTLPKL